MQRDKAPAGEASKPWYRHLTLWLVLMPAMGGVVAGLGIAVTGFSNPPQLVVDDRIDVGRATHQLHERERRAGELGLAARVHFDEAERLQVILSSSEGNDLPDQLAVTLYHPTMEDRDETYDLIRAGDGRYVAERSGDEPGRRYVHVEPERDGEWRLIGERQAEDAVLELRPRRPVFAERE